MSRTGRLASLEVENELAQEVLAPGAFTQLSLPLNLYLGGTPYPEMYSPKLKTKASFVGCIQTVVLNGREVINECTCNQKIYYHTDLEYNLTKLYLK